VRARLSRILLSWVQRERNGEMIQRGVFKNMVQMLVDLGLGSRSVYESEFETKFLETSVKFYGAESQLYMATNTVSDYMKKVERRMHEEAERVSVYLDPQTDSRIK
jgi:cullin 3